MGVIAELIGSLELNHCPSINFRATGLNYLYKESNLKFPTLYDRHVMVSVHKDFCNLVYKLVFLYFGDFSVTRVSPSVT